jgi:hypothetical protein
MSETGCIRNSGRRLSRLISIGHGHGHARSLLDWQGQDDKLQSLGLRFQADPAQLAQKASPIVRRLSFGALCRLMTLSVHGQISLFFF